MNWVGMERKVKAVSRARRKSLRAERAMKLKSALWMVMILASSYIRFHGKMVCLNRPASTLSAIGYSLYWTS